MSNVGQGNYYKERSKKWFIKNGYECVLLEVNYTIRIPGKLLYKKFDPLGSDGVAWNKDEFILWNSKSTSTKSSSKIKSSGRKEYSQYAFPQFIKKVLVVWKVGAREPEIVEVK